MTARNRVVREPYATWCGRTPVEIIHGLLPDSVSFPACRQAIGSMLQAWKKALRSAPSASLRQTAQIFWLSASSVEAGFMISTRSPLRISSRTER